MRRFVCRRRAPACGERRVIGQAYLRKGALAASQSIDHSLQLPIGSSTFQVHDCSSPTTRFGGRISKIKHVGSARENRSNHLALHADPLAVNDSHRAFATAPRLFKIVFNDRSNLTWRNRVQIDHVLEFDYYYVGKGIGRVELLAFAAVDCFGRRALGPRRWLAAAKPEEQKVEEHM
jgi:hypothetical protein